MKLSQIRKMLYDIVNFKKFRYESVVTPIVGVVLCNLPLLILILYNRGHYRYVCSLLDRSLDGTQHIMCFSAHFAYFNNI